MRRTLVLYQVCEQKMYNKSDVHYPPLAGVGYTNKVNDEIGVEKSWIGSQEVQASDTTGDDKDY